MTIIRVMTLVALFGLAMHFEYYWAAGGLVAVFLLLLVAARRRAGRQL